jgi:hypothetical protein
MGAEWFLRLAKRGVCTLDMCRVAIQLSERGMCTLDGCRVVCEVGREKGVHTEHVQSGLYSWQREVCTL